MTLPGDEEKLRLVPVLTTLLRLSPAEIEQLNKSIQGAKVFIFTCGEADRS